MKIKKDLKLNMEMIPLTSFEVNLRNAVTRKNWETIRSATYTKHNGKCVFCGKLLSLHKKDDANKEVGQCHEDWEFDDENHIMHLKGCLLVCQMCHNIKHFGRTDTVLIEQGILSEDEVMEHFIKVNGCDEVDYYEHKKYAWEKWGERSQYDWELDCGEFGDMMK